MKDLLVRLLLEEYKQQCLFEELQQKGIELHNICVNNLDIVLEIVGFPEDNTHEYDFTYLNTGGEVREEGKKIPDEQMFCRDWLTGKYYETFTELSTQQKVVVTEDGLRIESGAANEIVYGQLSEYIDWLYSELEKFRNGEK